MTHLSPYYAVAFTTNLREVVAHKMALIPPPPPPAPSSLTLFPQKVKSDATVYAVFSID